MFVDHVRIRVTAGAGGKGCCSFRREKYVPFGGPDGGDGGKGGDVYFAASARFSTLLDQVYHAHWKAERGAHGMGSDCHGKSGEDLIIQVPCGTLVRDFNSGEVLADLVEEGQRFLAARGGRGGKGNPRFATSGNRAPHFAEKGEPGEDREFLLELKLIADVGFVGLPNAGKSTLLSSLSAATPKIADYPFTTLSPNLGVAPLPGYRSLTLADIPGIIEGAAQGKGLGLDFLRHIERTRVLLFLIDLGDAEPAATFSVLENELSEYSPVFKDRPRVLAFNKLDVTENRERIPALQALFPKAHFISAATRNGVAELLEVLWTEVDRARKEEIVVPAMEPEREYTYEAPFQITRIPEGFRVEGKPVLRVVRMTDFDNTEAVRHLHQVLTRMGLFRALKRLGAQPGHSIFLEDVELEYQPD